MSTYAAETKVKPEDSRREIERTLRRYGATGFLFGEKDERAIIGFEFNGRNVRFEVTYPDPRDHEIAFTETGKRRDDEQIASAMGRAIRQRWRALALAIKAKLEIVESGMAEFDNEFLANIVLPGGQLVGDAVKSQLAIAYEKGRVPPLLPDYSNE